jgi:hypothetical protein
VVPCMADGRTQARGFRLISITDSHGSLEPARPRETDSRAVLTAAVVRLRRPFGRTPPSSSKNEFSPRQGARQIHIIILQRRERVKESGFYPGFTFVESSSHSVTHSVNRSLVFNPSCCWAHDNPPPCQNTPEPLNRQTPTVQFLFVC